MRFTGPTRRTKVGAYIFFCGNIFLQELMIIINCHSVINYQLIVYLSISIPLVIKKLIMNNHWLFINAFNLIIQFGISDSSSHFCERFGPSIRPSVCVCLSVRPSEQFERKAFHSENWIQPRIRGLSLVSCSFFPHVKLSVDLLSQNYANAHTLT